MYKSQPVMTGFVVQGHIWEELRVKLCQIKLILIKSDDFDRKVCNEFC